MNMHDCIDHPIINVVAALFNVSASGLRNHCRALGLTPMDVTSIVLSEMCGIEAAEPERRPGEPGDLCATCGHRRDKHCGCGKCCMAQVDGPMQFYSDQSIEALVSLWRDMSDIDLSKALSEPIGYPGCECKTGFVLVTGADS